MHIAMHFIPTPDDLLRLDYCSSFGPPSYAKPMTASSFEQLLGVASRLKKTDQLILLNQFLKKCCSRTGYQP